MELLLSKLEHQEKEINLYLSMIESYRKENEKQKEKINKLENRYKRNETERNQKQFLELVEKLKSYNSIDLTKELEQNSIEIIKKFDDKNIIIWLNKNQDKLKNIPLFSDIKLYKYDTFLKFKKKLKNNQDK